MHVAVQAAIVRLRHGLPRNTNTITLVKEEQIIPTSLDYLDGEQIIPLYAGKTIQWRKV